MIHLHRRFLAGIGIAVVIVLLVFSIPPLRRSQKLAQALPPETQRLLDSPETMQLYSLSPSGNPEKEKAPKEQFNGYRVLGSVAITDPKQRTALRESLYECILNSIPYLAGCFEPRHGLRVTGGGKTLDLVICFSCDNMSVIQQGQGKTVTIAGRPLLFNRLLDENNIPRSP